MEQSMHSAAEHIGFRPCVLLVFVSHMRHDAKVEIDSFGTLRVRRKSL